MPPYRPRNRWLHLFSRCSQCTRVGHVPGGGRPPLREGGPISYEARPSGFFQPVDAISASKRRGSTLQRFQFLYVKVQARIRPRLSYMCHIRTTAVVRERDQAIQHRVRKLTTLLSNNLPDSLSPLLHDCCPPRQSREWRVSKQK